MARPAGRNARPAAAPRVWDEAARFWGETRPGEKPPRKKSVSRDGGYGVQSPPHDFMAISFATRSNLELIEQNYEQWRKNPEAVDSTWAAFFDGFELGASRTNGAPARAEWQGRRGGAAGHPRGGARLRLPHARAHHRESRSARPGAARRIRCLSLRELGFSEKDLDLAVASRFYLGGQRMKLREMIASLEACYCGTIGAEFMHIQNPRVRNWVRDRLESRVASYRVPAETQQRMLQQILSVEHFEHFLHTRYVGQKRFSIEGGESLIAALYGLLESCPRHKVVEMCMGMAHRGRLSVIREFLGKSLSVMFAEFSENFLPNTVGGDGDVKYHLGYTTTREIEGQQVDIRLSANPEPSRGGQSRGGRNGARPPAGAAATAWSGRRCCPILIHGDAAFAGQGIVAETLNMSQLPGYRTGGTVHIIVNNQIGFTTLPEDARSSRYCTDVAKMIEAPVFHVNGDDPLAVRFCAELAFDFRQQFKSDVVIDMYCYRRYGHNESDEPLYTQPLMYTQIGSHASVGTHLPAAADRFRRAHRRAGGADQQGSGGRLRGRLCRGESGRGKEGAEPLCRVKRHLSGAVQPRAGRRRPSRPRRSRRFARGSPPCRRAFTWCRGCGSSSSKSASRSAARAGRTIGRTPRRSPGARC